jgi:hypothetical protein
LSATSTTSSASSLPPKTTTSRGVVEQVGAKVSGFSIGDRIFGIGDVNRPGAYAELVAADYSKIMDKAVPEESLKEIQKQLKKASPWAQAKASYQCLRCWPFTHNISLCNSQ